MSDSNLLSHRGCMQRGATEHNKKNPGGEVVSAIVKRSQELSQRQLNAIDLLLQGHGDAQVALQVGVDRTTVFRWRRNARFVKQLEEFRELLWRQSQARLEALLEPALDVLQHQIGSEDPKTALRAAAVLLRTATPSRLERGPQYMSASIEFDEPDDLELTEP